MRLKNKWKRFWTLDVHNHAGFTLVELIIVIAILAILSTGAIAGYSAYIERANITTDKALIAEIENVLLMAGYSGSFVEGDSGYLLLTTAGVTDFEENANMVKVLQDAYGPNWDSVLKLNYGSWGNSGLSAGLTGQQAQAVKNSSYYAAADDLMVQVEEITNVAYQIINGSNGASNKAEITQMFADADMSLDVIAATYGYDSFDDVPNDALPNLLVLAVAGDVTYKQQLGDEHTTSQATGIITEYAQFNAYASTGKDEAFSKAYDDFTKAVANKDNVADIALAYDALQDAANASEGFAKYKGSPQYQTDIDAFTAMMGGMAGAAAMNTDNLAQNLKDQSFFTSGMGNDLFNTYLDAVEAAAGLSSDASNAIANLLLPENAGAVAIYFTYASGEIVIQTTLPNE